MNYLVTHFLERGKEDGYKFLDQRKIFCQRICRVLVLYCYLGVCGQWCNYNTWLVQCCYLFDATNNSDTLLQSHCGSTLRENTNIRNLKYHVINLFWWGFRMGFYQEALLKKGCVWHYTQYDKRPTFAQVCISFIHFPQTWTRLPIHNFKVTGYGGVTTAAPNTNPLYVDGSQDYLTTQGFIYCQWLIPGGVDEQWEREAKAARVGLWAVVNPEKPWEYRKDKRDARRN